MTMPSSKNELIAIPKSNILVKKRVSLKAKNIFIKINLKNEVELVIPKNIPHNLATNFLIKKQDWIIEKLNNISYPKIADNQIRIFGELFEIKTTTLAKDNIVIKEQQLLIDIKIKNPKKEIVNFLKRILFDKISIILQELSLKYNLFYKEIKIIASKNKWGSCSQDKILAFNWRLIFADPKVLNYVIIHELCHLQEMSHNKKFWQLVKAICPDYKILRKTLKDNSRELHSYLNYTN